MTDGISFFVQGDPAPQGSKSQDRRGRMFESSKRVKPWRQAVAMEVVAMPNRKQHQFGSNPVWVTLHFFTKRLWADDADKLVRSTLDALVESGMLDDDRYVQTIQVRKDRPRRGEPTGCLIRVDNEENIPDGIRLRVFPSAS